jgi:hypothetical protein
MPQLPGRYDSLSAARCSHSGRHGSSPQRPGKHSSPSAAQGSRQSIGHRSHSGARSPYRSRQCCPDAADVPGPPTSIQPFSFSQAKGVEASTLVGIRFAKNKMPDLHRSSRPQALAMLCCSTAVTAAYASTAQSASCGQRAAACAQYAGSLSHRCHAARRPPHRDACPAHRKTSISHRDACSIQALASIVPPPSRALYRVFSPRKAARFMHASLSAANSNLSPSPRPCALPPGAGSATPARRRAAKRACITPHRARRVC